MLRVPGRPLTPGEPPDPLQYELLQEMAASLGAAGTRLQRALAALAACAVDDPRRDERVARAGEALWYWVVQREACGLRDTEALVAEMGVPAEVRLRMGHRRKP